MRLRNMNLAGHALATATGETVVGDADGWFDLDETTAARVIGTPGWTSRQAAQAPAQAPQAEETGEGSPEGTEPPQEGTEAAEAAKPKRSPKAPKPTPAQEG